jgi:hypothetical protein
MCGLDATELENCSKLMITRLSKLYDRFLFIGSPVRVGRTIYGYLEFRLRGWAQAAVTVTAL